MSGNVDGIAFINTITIPIVVNIALYCRILYNVIIIKYFTSKEEDRRMDVSQLKETFISKTKKLSKTLVTKVNAMSKKQKIISGSLLALLLIVLISISNYFSKPLFNPMEYADIEITGLNTNGEANLIIDGNIPYSEENGFFSSLSKQIKVYEMVNHIEYDVSPKENLSNGDTVTIKALYDKNYFKEIGYRLGKNTKKVKVKNLRDGRPIDVFETLEVKYEGIAPYGHVSVNNNNSDEFIRTIDYLVENNNHLKNGDKINVTANYDKYIATEKGCIVKEDIKEYTVDGLAKYAMDKADLTKATTDKISKEMQDKLEAYLIDENKWVYAKLTDSYFFHGVNFEGTDHINLAEKHFLSAKKSEDSYTANRTLFIYEFAIKANGKPYPGYIAVYADNISLKPDNSFSDIKEIGISTISSDLQTVYDQNITAYKDQFIIQDL